MSEVEIKDKDIFIKFDKNIYDLSDIKRTYDLLKDKCVVVLSDDKNCIKAQISCLNVEPKAILEKFLYTLSNQQIKSQLLKENGKLRDLIVEHAFKPLSNLEERANEL